MFNPFEFQVFDKLSELHLGAEKDRELCDQFVHISKMDASLVRITDNFYKNAGICL